MNVVKVVVTAVFPEDRIIDVAWYSGGQQVRRVYVLNPSGNYSFPNVGDVGLMLDDEISAYYLGRIDNRYRAKITGEFNAQMPKARVVNGGEAVIMNLLKDTWLALTNTENFELKSGSDDGLSFRKMINGIKFRMLQLTAQTITMVASAQSLLLGAVTREFPGLGRLQVADPIVPTTSAVEVLAEVKDYLTNIRKVKLHLGNIFMEPVTTPASMLEEHTTIAQQALRVLLGVYESSGLLTLGSLKMDYLGNVELEGTPQVMLDAVQILLGGATAAGLAEPAVLGNSLVTWLNAHTHASAWGPTGIPIVQAVPTTEGFLSKKIFMA